jgi:glycosyltransferase 2 family protein
MITSRDGRIFSGGYGMVLKAIMTAAVIAAVAFMLVELPDDSASVRIVLPEYIGWAVALAPVVLLFKSVKWFLLLRSIEPMASFNQAARSYVCGIPLGLVTPGRLGEISRLLFLPHNSTRGMTGVGIVMIDKMTELPALLCWLAVALLIQLDSWPIVSGASIIAAASVLFTLHLHRGAVIAARITKRLPAWRGIDRLFTEIVMAGAYVTPARMSAVLTFGLLSFGVEWVQYWLVFRASMSAGESLSIAHIAAAMSIVTLGNAAQITLAGIGIREALSVMLLGNVIPPIVAALGAASVFLVDQALPALFGIMIARIPANKRTLRE